MWYRSTLTLILAAFILAALPLASRADPSDLFSALNSLNSQSFNPHGRSKEDNQRLMLYKMNQQTIRNENMAPLEELAREDSFAGSFSRFAAQVGSGVDVARTGYHRRIGWFDLHIREADMPDGSQGVASSVDFKIIDHLKLDLTNDSPVGGNTRQTANILFQFPFNLR